MVMSDEDVTESMQFEPRSDQLARRAITAVNKIGYLINYEQRRGIASAAVAWPTLTDTGTTLGTEQDEASL
jgi:hypothetical protein